MTGFGSAEYRDDEIHLTIDIKSYNNRYLDIYVNEPSYLAPIEPNIRKKVAGKILRGKVEVRINIVNYSEDIEVFLDEKNIETYIKVLREIISKGSLEDDVRLSHLLRMDGIIKRESTTDTEKIWEKLEPVLEEAIVNFDETRILEGEATKIDILDNLKNIEGELLKIEGYVPLMEERLMKNLRERFEELLPQDNEGNEQRILAETAVLLARFDINEEIQRMKSHLQHFRKIIEGGGSVGKKLDFVCQEMNREINTIGSKNILSELDGIVISVKDALEKIREQVRNVE